MDLCEKCSSEDREIVGPVERPVVEKSRWCEVGRGDDYGASLFSPRRALGAEHHSHGQPPVIGSETKEKLQWQSCSMPPSWWWPSP